VATFDINLSELLVIRRRFDLPLYRLESGTRIIYTISPSPGIVFQASVNNKEDLPYLVEYSNQPVRKGNITVLTLTFSVASFVCTLPSPPKGVKYDIQEFVVCVEGSVKPNEIPFKLQLVLDNSVILSFDRVFEDLLELAKDVKVVFISLDKTYNMLYFPVNFSVYSNSKLEVMVTDNRANINFKFIGDELLDF